MRRRLMIVLTVGVSIMAGIGAVLFIGQKGVFGGKAKQLFMSAEESSAAGDMTAAQSYLEELVTTFPDSQWADDGLLRLGEVFEAQQQFVEARAMYQTLLDKFTGSPLTSAAQERLGSVNIGILFSPLATEEDIVHEVVSGDTLGAIALTYGTTVALIKEANSLDSDVIFPKQNLKIPSGEFEVVVDKSQNQLLLTKNSEFVKSYSVATGKDSSTPVGAFKIVNKIPDPVWYSQGAVVPQDSPENILGTRWMGFDKKGYGIHGSVDPDAIGHQVTAGCVRMSNVDVEELFTIVPVGTSVTIVD